MENDTSIENYLIESLKLPEKNSEKCLLFKYPKESRFKLLFDSIKTKKRKRTMSINPKNIILGLDKRTSIIIKHIPEYFTPQLFMKVIAQYTTDLDFFYIPSEMRTRRKLRVAFVNVLDPLQIVPIYMGLLYKSKFIYNNPNIQMEICYSKAQGKNQLIKRFFQ